MEPTISLVQLAADVNLRNQKITEVQNYCSSQLCIWDIERLCEKSNSFWECLNATFKDKDFMKPIWN
ncbi:hypothetical protein NQ315_005804 [Exocentrus adspersus]|uniref:Uncharacterized protein n=1 Tax=Exocentrus adspersus TaxID=1586481 RepID=A0AAV8VRZ8_9CUCU|nr:hypothetical protein NQ315_005804 [Exocentrus adspersus]